MNDVHISLFGQFEISRGTESLYSLSGTKTTELLVYLFVHHSRPHTREALSSLLWPEGCTTTRAKTYLRKTLWQVQKELSAYSWLSELSLLTVDTDWVRLKVSPDVWFDLALFEEAYAGVKGLSGHVLEPEQVVVLDEAVDLYTDSLLANWYQRWCLQDQQRIRQMYLLMLDKLLEYSSVHQSYDKGLEYGERILRIDPAREWTHRQLMHLRWVSGDRTGALRQYQACLRVLREELDVAPSFQTQQLYDQIRSGQSGYRPDGSSLDEHFRHIRHVQRMLQALHNQVEKEMTAIDTLLNRGE